MKKQAYRQFDVWRRTQHGEARSYRCFQGLTDGLFYIQSCDAHRPSEEKTQRQLAQQFVELFCEEEPCTRTAGLPSLEEALAAFDTEFGIRSDE